MQYEDQTYHQERAEHCRTLAQLATDPEIRRRHEELAALHVSRASQFPQFAQAES